MELRTPLPMEHPWELAFTNAPIGDEVILAIFG